MNKLCNWLGHNYQPRFDKTPARFSIDGARGFSSGEIARMAEPFRQVTYVRDVCKRCGATIERAHDTNGREIPR